MITGKKLESCFGLFSIMPFKKFAKHLFLRFAQPRHGIKKLVINGLEASFYTKDYEQLRYLNQIVKNREIDETILLGQLLNVLKQGDVAYDIGANIGLHTIFMAKKVGCSGHVYAFEPETTTIRSG